MPAESLPTELSGLSLRTVSLPEPLEFGRSPREDLAHLRFLRDVTSHAVRLRWTLAGQPCFPLYTHLHLVPPSAGSSAHARAYAAQWTASYRYGSFYYRRGPDLVQVKDVRAGVAASRMVITDGADAFLRLAEDPVGAPGPEDEAAASVAVEAGLALRAGEAVLVLPYRIRHWPVPHQGI